MKQLRAAFDLPTTLAVLGTLALTVAGALVWLPIGLAVFGVLAIVASVAAARGTVA